MVLFHIYSDYSLLKSSLRIKDLVQKAKEYGYTSLGISEFNNLFSAIEFYETCKKEEINPIIGADILIKRDERVSNLILLAKSYQGYKNLMKLLSISYLYHMKVDKAILPYEELIKNKDSLIAILPMFESEVSFHLDITNEENILKGAKGYDEAKKIASIYRDDFDEIYLEIRRDKENLIENDLISLSKEVNIPLIASNKVTYLDKLDYIYKDALECIGDNKQFDDIHRKFDIGEYYLKEKSEMENLFSDLKEAIENNKKLENIKIEIPLNNPTPPTFKFTKEYAKKEGLDIESDVEYFEYKCKEGLKKRLKNIPKEKHEIYKKRLEHEIEIIKKMKFPGYMLIVWDFINYAKDPTRHLRGNKRKIPVGPGRGSAAGSLVSYVLEITNIDPIKYGLLFERFLNPERVSMPDIDVDFCQERREEVIEYVQKKYGHENVAQVVTFGSLLAKGVLRDIARIFGIDYSTADKFVKLIPEQLGITLKKAKELEPKIKEIINSEPLYERLYSFGEKLEGLKRNTGKHAAGVVISDTKLYEKAPLYKQNENDEFHTTQYSLNYLEAVDLIKFDFLGLKTLTVIDKAILNIKQNKNKEINIDEIDIEDKKIYELIQSGKTLGLFQIESEGMQDLAKRLKPEKFEDIIAMLALYRPGPMDAGMLDDYIERKHGRKEISYFFDEFKEVLEPILKPTYGVIVYQEQVMQIVQAIAGFSLGEADIIRRAMGKKKADLMAKYSEEFAKRAQERGFSYENAKALFNLIEKFAGYGFNKSHSAAYAMITIQTAFLKTYYPTEFFASLMTYEADNLEKIAKYIDEAKSMNIEVLPPDVNKSDANFTPLDNKILFGLNAIKGVGTKAIESIIENRPFKDIKDFILKVDTTKVNKKVLEQLIKSGAMDSFGYNRRTLFENIENMLDFKKRVEDKKNALKNSLFASVVDEKEVDEELVIIPKEEFDKKTLLDGEYETLGIYVSGHPLDPFKGEIEKLNYNLSSEIENILNQEALFVGKVEAKKVKISKKGNKFAIISLLDYHGKIDIMVFERDLNKLEEMDLEKPIAIKAYVEKIGEFLRISGRKILSLSEAKNEKAAIREEVCVLKFELSEDYEKDLIKIYNKLTKNPGNKRAILELTTPFGFSLRVDTNIKTSYEKDLDESISNSTGI